jgi:hypothetical protein
MKRRYGFLTAIALIVAGVAYFAPVGQTQDSAQTTADVTVASAGSGGPASVGAALSVDMAAVPEATAAELAAVALRQTPRPQSGLSEAQEAARLALVRSTDWASIEGAVVSDGPVIEPANGGVGIATPGAIKSFAGIPFTGLNPPDMGLAVGTQYVLQTVNSSVTVLNKTSGAVATGFPKTLQAFLGRPAGAFLFDPRALYDWVKNRWIVVVDELEFGTGGRGFLNIAVSRTNNPTGLWAVYRIQMGGAGSCPDYPTLGQDRDIIYISANRFGCNSDGFTGPYQTSEVWLLPKKEMYAAAAFSFWFQNGFNVGGTQVDTLQPVNVQNKSDRVRAEFMVNTFNINFGGGQCFSGCSGVVVWAISNPRGFVTGGPAPRFTGVIVPTTTYALAPGLRTPTTVVAALDTRITGSVNYSAGRLYASTTTRVNTSPTTSGVLWWEIEPFLNDNDPACTGAFLNKCATINSALLRQQDCYNCGAWGNGGGTSFGTLQPDNDNNLTMVFAFSSFSFEPGTAYVSRRVTYPPNLMHDSGIFLAAGAGAANTGSRWGDYYATAPDLASAIQPYMWFAGMYARAGDGRWNTQIGKNGFTAINQP